MTWVEPITEASQGFDSFMGSVMPILLYVGLGLFVSFTFIGIMRAIVAKTT